MTLATVLELGRISNLPTVWTNCLAASVLAGGGAPTWSIATTAIALSLFYCGGMFLNDAFDREVDALERPQRPIPSGHVSAAAVFTLGTAQLVAGMVLLVLVARSVGGRLDLVLGSGAALAIAIVAYDAVHRATSLSPWLMAACRALVYACTAAATTPTPQWSAVLPAAAALAAYTAGITYVSRVEASGVASRSWPFVLLVAAPIVLLASSGGTTDLRAWGALASIAWIFHALRFATRSREPDVSGGVMRLIAGMCVIDGAWIAGGGAGGDAMRAALALVGLPATRLLQRRVAGS